mmetsp:Transcript_3711/g.9967  ORF Transcript_3711/g.9967 Transcript_3711/m.9967 type:complete len:277 (-) Transcript_3711:305-1135(-)
MISPPFHKPCSSSRPCSSPSPQEALSASHSDGAPSDGKIAIAPGLIPSSSAENFVSMSGAVISCRSNPTSKEAGALAATPVGGLPFRPFFRAAVDSSTLSVARSRPREREPTICPASTSITSGALPKADAAFVALREEARDPSLPRDLRILAAADLAEYRTVVFINPTPLLRSASSMPPSAIPAPAAERRATTTISSFPRPPPAPVSASADASSPSGSPAAINSMEGARLFRSRAPTSARTAPRGGGRDPSVPCDASALRSLDEGLSDSSSPLMLN